MNARNLVAVSIPAGPLVGANAVKVHDGPCRVWTVIGSYNGTIASLAAGSFRDTPAAATAGTTVFATGSAQGGSAVAGSGFMWEEDFFGVDFKQGCFVDNATANGTFLVIAEKR